MNVSQKLPDGWASVKLGDILSERLVNGRSVPTREDGFPVLRLTALRAGTIDLTQHKSGAWTEDEARPYLVRVGDFLVSRGSGSRSLVGRGGLVRHDLPHVAFPDTMIRIRATESAVVPDYLCLVWDSQVIRDQIEAAARTTAGIYKINQGVLEAIALPLPPLAEQRRIVAVLDNQINNIDRLTTSLELAQVRAAHLRRSLQAQAFTGQLVPQYPSDEPLTEPLAQMHAERSTWPNKNRRKANNGVGDSKDTDTVRFVQEEIQL